MNHFAQPQPEFSPRDGEELVAYLDGELDDAACERVEQRMASDPAYRLELQRLQRTWDYLDGLPETPLDETFTRSTIEMAAVVASQEIAQVERAAPARRQARAVLAASLLLVSLLAGFALTAAIWPDPNRELVRDLAIIENLDQYRYVEDVQYLRTLQASDLQLDELQLDESLDGAAEAGPARSAPPRRSDESRGGRRAWIETLSSAQKAELLNSQKRFANLPLDQQRRVRALHEQIARDPEAAELRRTLALYHGWMNDLSPGRRADLLALDDEQRLQAIERIADEQQRQRSRTLSSEDARALLAWLGERALLHRERILRDTPRSRRRHFEKLGSDQQQALLMVLAWRRSRSGNRSPLAPLGREDLASLRSHLSPEAQAKLEQAGDFDRQKRLIYAWVHHTMVRHHVLSRAFGRGPTSLSQEELETFFSQNLTSDQRAELLSLPTEEMQRDLRRLYFEGESPSLRRPERPDSGRGSFPSRNMN